jgi:hypothetical protein
MQWHAAVIADQVASGVLVDVATLQLHSERKWLEVQIQCLQMQNTEAIRDKTATENKSRNLLEKHGSLGKENEGLSRQLSEVKDTATQAQTKA